MTLSVALSVGVIVSVVGIISALAGAWLGIWSMKTFQEYQNERERPQVARMAEPTVRTSDVITLLLSVASFQDGLAGKTQDEAEADAREFSARVLRGVAERVRLGEFEEVSN